MELVTYVTCTIHSRSLDNRLLDNDYSERSLVELHKQNPGSYVLRGIDVENKKKEIFEIPLTKRDIYKYGASFNQPDEIQYNNTTYRLYLKQESHAKFHEELEKCFADMDSSKQSSSRSRTIAHGNEILVDIRQLTESIENGDATNAEKLAKKLALQSVQLTKKTVDDKLREDMLQIRIRIDHIGPHDHHSKEEHTLRVYSSTTVHELRAMFHYTHGFPLAHQYFFVNGHLAHAGRTMKDLAVEEDTLFVLLFTAK